MSTFGLGLVFILRWGTNFDTFNVLKILQHRLMQIIEAWRSAKQMLKAVDQRAAAVTAALSSSANVPSGDAGISSVNSGAGNGGRGGGGIGGATRRGGGGFRGGPRRRPPSVNLVEEIPASSVTE